jgi:signal transduction histidine kinase
VRAVAGVTAVALANVQDLARIKALEAQREEFLSVVAHDLRTPIGVIRNYAAVLKRTALRRKEEAQAAEAISVNAQRLATMVGDLLDASRIEADRLAFSVASFDLSALIRRIAEHLAAILAGHALRVELPGEPLVAMADAGRVEQVLTNLLTNAGKYAPEGTEIVLSARREGIEAVVCVRDQGPGIAPSDQAALFQRFYRTASARAGKQEGLGLGLYISRGLVEAQGGRIWVESAPGEGSGFLFTVPLDMEKVSGPGSERRRPYEASGTIPA